MKKFSVLLVAILACAATGFGQNVSSSLRAAFLDSSGAAVPGAASNVRMAEACVWPALRLCFGRAMFIQYQDAMGWQIVVSGESISGQKVMHRFIELEPKWRVLMIQKEIYPGIIFLPQTDLNVIGHFQQRMQVAQLPQPNDQIIIEVLVA